MLGGPLLKDNRTVRYCILGDIHANYEALATVVEYAESQNCEKYLSVGDVVGYGAEPSKCISKVRELNAPTVAGNHDYAVTGKLDVEFFNSYAKPKRVPVADSNVPRMDSTEEFDGAEMVVHSTFCSGFH